MCNHSIHANSGRVDLNCHPKWSILGSASLRNLRRKIKCYFFPCTLQFSSGFHFILRLIICFMYVNSLENSHFDEYCVIGSCLLPSSLAYTLTHVLRIFNHLSIFLVTLHLLRNFCWKYPSKVATIS
jgi:hypothetical protein